MSLLRTADPHQQSISDHDLRLDYDTSRVLMGFVRNQSILSVNHLQVKPIGQKSISSGTKTPFWLFDVLVLSPPRRTVLVLVIEAIRYRNSAHWFASYRKPPRSTVGIAAVQTAIEYEYRFTEYRPLRRTEYEYDEIRCEVDQVCLTEHSGTDPEFMS